MAENARSKKRKQRNKQKKPFTNRKEPKWKQQVKQIEDVKSKYDSINPDEITRFSDIPLSPPTLEGLMKAGFAEPTEIQKAAIPLALCGNDVLGAAKTGSGKTLAFLIPVLELLWRERWSDQDKLGALIISPTRELAYQTFEVLRKVGGCHDFSAGLVIGGHDLVSEQKQIQRTNIIVCTPGRLLQHMDETPDFECIGLKVLVVDETDRILDLGFRQAMKNILENLPSERQTLLFSATQTKSVKDLALLSLKDPEYISVHEESQTSTPYQLSQSYIVCNLQDKLSTLYSFIKSHLTSKIIIFMSSCKQVKFTYEAFRRFQPGVPLMALYGRQKQLKRVAIYNDFCRKKSAVLLSTDVAARGLDFPCVDWVVQLDCPEDVNTYIHRVGRTARYEKDGQALLFLLPSEKQGMLAGLEAKKIPIEKITVNPKKLMSIQSRLNAFCAQDVEMKQWAQRSFICYLRSVHLQSNKEVFDVRKLPTNEYAESLGLSQAPRIRFLKKGCLTDSSIHLSEEEEEEDENSSSEDESDEETLVETESGKQTKSEANKADSESASESEQVDRKKTNSDKFSKLSAKRLKKMADDDILTVKSVTYYGQGVQPDTSEDDWESETRFDLTTTSKASQKPKSKYASVKKLIRKGIKQSQHIRFSENESSDDHSDNGSLSGKEMTKGGSSDNKAVNSICPVSMEDYEKDIGTTAVEEKVSGINITTAKLMMKTVDSDDRRRERLRVKQEHSKRRRKERQKRREVEGEEGIEQRCVTLGDASSTGSETEDQIVQDEEEEPPAKRLRKTVDSSDGESHDDNPVEESIANDEELALHLLTKLS